MTVSELVEARKDHMSKVKEIDEVLGEAVKAIGGIQTKLPLAPSPVRQYTPGPVPSVSSYDPAFGPPDRGGASTLSVGTEAPVMRPPQRNAADQSSGFTIFDAEAAARQQAEAEEQYLVDNPQVAQQVPQYDFDSEEIVQEIDDLKSKIKKQTDNQESSKPTE